MHITIRILVAACAVFSTVTATDYNIKVGKLEKGLPVFDPSYLSGLKTGDRFTFDFSSSNLTHEIYQSTFEDPCHRNIIINGSREPIVRTTTYRVTETMDGPMWYFCAVGSHCKTGMVFALNPGPSPLSFEAFKAKAASSTTNLIPISDAKKTSIRNMTGLGGLALLVVGLLIML